jgi:hypothetical protein
MECYYGKVHKDSFERFFGKHYIRQRPTPKANAYLVLKFDFSGIETTEIEGVYDGCRFNTKIEHRLYNPDMALYFASAFAEYGKYPETLLDTNVSSDYGKIGRPPCSRQYAVGVKRHPGRA